MIAPFAVVWAHLGGIDEIGIFVIPAAAIILLLRRAERRAKERQAADKPPAEVEGPHADR